MTTRDLWVRSQLVGLRAICVALIALHSFFTRTRMSHENGIVARGRIRLVDDLAIPENDFFLPGREFACRLRHASVSLMDDAGLFVRAASLKFADADIDSPLDLLMNGGSAAPFWNMHTFAQFMLARVRGGRAHLIPYFQANPRCFENVVSALRLRPDSFASLRYYSQTPFRVSRPRRPASLLQISVAARRREPGDGHTARRRFANAMVPGGAPRRDLAPELSEGRICRARSEPRRKIHSSDAIARVAA
jgi:hypothetical protein